LSIDPNEFKLHSKNDWLFKLFIIEMGV
jgi:hypothetical protein